MAFPAEPMDRADQVFRIGPEDLVAQSSSIVAGSIVSYSREIQRYSAPGPDAIALVWTAQGRIDNPTTLKGAPPPVPIRFSKPERSFFLAPSSTTPIWETAFGELAPSGRAVLFFGEDAGPRVLPSGSGDQDLIALVKDIVRIQAIRDPDQQRRSWLQYLAGAPSMEGRHAALRSLVRAGAGWSEMEPALTQLAIAERTPPDLRAFAFGFVAYQVTVQTWGARSKGSLDFLCQMFSAETGTEQQLRYLQSFKLLLSYAVEEPRQESRRLVQQSIMGCLETWASHGLSVRELRQEYNQVRQKYSDRQDY